MSFFIESLVSAVLEVEIIRKVERDDVLRFYDRFISPRSTQRRKLALHVNPSPLALRASTNGQDGEEAEEENATPDDSSLTNVQALEGQKNSSTTDFQIPTVIERFSSLNERSVLIFIFSPNGSTMFIRGKVNCHAIHWLNLTKRSIFRCFANYNRTIRFQFIFLIYR